LLSEGLENGVIADHGAGCGNHFLFTAVFKTSLTKRTQVGTQVVGAVGLA
jgi:hypothetical protein